MRSLAGVLSLSLILLGGCEVTSEPPPFDLRELSFTDTLRITPQRQRIVVVLEQLADGPIDEYRNVSYETTSHPSADSISMLLEVEGLQGTAEPTAYAHTRIEWTRDTLFVWYADTPREDVARLSGQPSANGPPPPKTSPAEPYLKVKRVRFEHPEDVEIANFSNRFFR